MKDTRSRKIFVDANVIIDYLVNRKHHTKYANDFFEYVGRSSIMLYVCSFSFAIVYHYLRTENVPHRIALSALDSISKRTHCLSVGDTIIKQAMKSSFRDFEDAVQYFCAVQIPECEAIISRNPQDFEPGIIPVVTPKFFAGQ